MHTARYGIAPTLLRDAKNFTFKSSTAQCIVQCALKCVATREECLIGNGGMGDVSLGIMGHW